tara:strand:+ start:719 stop:1009 length:291 start_codon:yes stop_codon:yes gene_type:complete
MHPISFLEKYSEVNTRRNVFYRVLQQGCHLDSEYEVMLLVDHCLDVFVVCDFQLPSYLAQRLSDCSCPLDDFFEYAFEMLAATPEEFFLTAKKRKN